MEAVQMRDVSPTEIVEKKRRVMTWIDQVNYSFIDQRPRAYRNRNGKLGPEMRTREHWRIALQGHTETAHGGKVDGACPACRELSAKVASKGMP